MCPHVALDRTKTLHNCFFLLTGLTVSYSSGQHCLWSFCRLLLQTFRDVVGKNFQNECRCSTGLVSPRLRLTLWPTTTPAYMTTGGAVSVPGVPGFLFKVGSKKKFMMNKSNSERISGQELVCFVACREDPMLFITCSQTCSKLPQKEPLATHPEIWLTKLSAITVTKGGRIPTTLTSAHSRLCWCFQRHTGQSSNLKLRSVVGDRKEKRKRKIQIFTYSWSEKKAGWLITCQNGISGHYYSSILFFFFFFFEWHNKEIQWLYNTILIQQSLHSLVMCLSAVLLSANWVNFKSKHTNGTLL